MENTTVTTDSLVHDLLVAQRAADRAEEKVAAIKKELGQRIAVGENFDGTEAKVSHVQAVNRVVDIDTLQSVASKGFFYKVTKRVIDMGAFKALEELGQVPEPVQEIVQERLATPYVKVTVKV